MNELFALLLSMHVHTVTLSFDDGPDPRYTKQVLQILKDNHVQANFFLVGQRMVDHPELVTRIVNEGHDIGGHSMTHKELTKIPLEQARWEILQSMLMVNHYQKTNLFRFPYGDFNPSLVKIVHDHGYRNIFWKVDTLDWKYKDKNEIYTKFKVKIAHCPDGSIILMHDIHPQTVEFLRLAIPFLKANNIKIEKIK